jgi:hypothetical protein
MEAERRLAIRHSFIAHAEVFDEQHATRLEARVSDLSLSGCYLDMLHPLPEGTNIFIKVASEAGGFQAKGRIVYAVPALGA